MVAQQLLLVPLAVSLLVQPPFMVHHVPVVQRVVEVTRPTTSANGVDDVLPAFLLGDDSSFSMPSLPSIALPTMPKIDAPSLELPSSPKLELPKLEVPKLELPSAPSLELPSLPSTAGDSDGFARPSSSSLPPLPKLEAPSFELPPAPQMPKLELPSPQLSPEQMEARLAAEARRASGASFGVATDEYIAKQQAKADARRAANEKTKQEFKEAALKRSAEAQARARPVRRCSYVM